MASGARKCDVPAGLAALYARTRLNVHPPRYDAFGMSIVEAAAFGAWTPFVWAHQCGGAATEATFVLLSTRSESDFVGAARAQTASLYLVAAFWKLTTSFLDYRTSCATVLVAEVLTPVLLAALRSAAVCSAAVCSSSTSPPPQGPASQRSLASSTEPELRTFSKCRH